MFEKEKNTAFAVGNNGKIQGSKNIMAKQ